MLGGPRERSGFPPPSGGFTPPICGLFLLRRSQASYAKAGSRDQLSKDPVFGQEFERAKQRVNTMDIRFVEETDAVRQALLEIYVALALETTFNDFDNH